MEIERKYLPALTMAEMEKEILPLARRRDWIEQAYLSFSPTIRVRRRVRVSGERLPGEAPTPEGSASCILTVKGKGILAREEYELPMEEVDYCRLLTKKEGGLIRKERYEIPLEQDGLVAEVDIFHDDHEGLCQIEVEFPNMEASRLFIPAPWFGREVTGDKSYYNSYLALHPYRRS